MNLLTVQDLSFAYGNQLIVRELKLALAAGEIVALLGPNGSGKSTLIKLLMGHLNGTGSIEWEDKPLADWSRRELARRVAYLPQFPAFEAGQLVSDALRMGRAPYWGAFGLESIEDTQMVQRVATMLQLDDLMERPLDELSGGQRQRIFIGRCLVQNPRALLLDEPSTSLDLRHQVELCKLLAKLAREQNIGVLMASHDLNLAGIFATRLVVLHEGRILADGKANEVLQPELLTKVYGLPMRRIDADPPLVIPDLH